MTDWLNRCHFGDVRDVLRRMIADGVKVNTIVTSPPYWGLRDYGHAGQIGLEPTPELYVSTMVEVFALCREVLADDGTLWLNLGDSYTSGGRTHDRDPDAKHVAVGTGARRVALPDGLKPKDLVGIPWMTAFALRADGWYLRQEIIWAKPNPMPESVKDRCTKSHEQIFLLAKSASYYCDMESIKEAIAESTANDSRLTQEGYDVERPERGFPGQASRGSGLLVPKGDPTKRNKRSVWTVSTKPYKGAHFATFPTDLIEPCILAGAPAGGIVLDPFFGSGTTGQVAQALGRQFIGLELNEAYKPLQDERLRQPSLSLE
jgi:DNA modification methylase